MILPSSAPALILRPTRIRHYVDAMNARGFSAADVLAGSGVIVERLQDSTLLIDLRQYETIINNMLRISGNPALGFEIGAEVRLSDLGILAHAIMSAATLAQAMALWSRFYNLVGMPIKIDIENNGQSRTTICKTLGVRYPVSRFCVEEILMIGVKLGEMLSGKPYILQECTFAYPRPVHAALYSELLSCPITFNAPQNRFKKSPQLTDTPVLGNDPVFNEICVRHCSRVMHQSDRHSPLVAQLRGLFLSRSAHIPSLRDAAASLNISSRSLKRHLQAENTSFQVLVDEFRLDLAKEYLKSGQLTQKEIGFLLGFSSAAAFARAFKSWTGQTILQYRHHSNEKCLLNN